MRHQNRVHHSSTHHSNGNSKIRALRQVAPVQEGRTTRAVETVTAKVPSIGYLGLAAGSMAISAALALTKRKSLANFIGLWAPSLLIVGLYNKLVKIEYELTESSDRISK